MVLPSAPGGSRWAYQVGLLRSGLAAGRRVSCCRYCCSWRAGLLAAAGPGPGLRLMLRSRSRWVCRLVSSLVAASVPARLLRPPGAAGPLALLRSSPRCWPGRLPLATGCGVPGPAPRPPWAELPGEEVAGLGRGRPLASGRLSGGACEEFAVGLGWLISPGRSVPAFSAACFSVGDFFGAGLFGESAAPALGGAFRARPGAGPGSRSALHSRSGRRGCAGSE
jgi:hypothetical protein